MTFPRAAIFGLFSIAAGAALAADPDEGFVATTAVSVQFGAGGFGAPGFRSRLTFAGAPLYQRDWRSGDVTGAYPMLVGGGFSFSTVATSLGFVGAVYGMSQIAGKTETIPVSETTATAAPAPSPAPAPAHECKKKCGEGDKDRGGG